MAVSEQGGEWRRGLEFHLIPCVPGKGTHLSEPLFPLWLVVRKPNTLAGCLWRSERKCVRTIWLSIWNSQNESLGYNRSSNSSENCTMKVAAVIVTIILVSTDTVIMFFLNIIHTFYSLFFPIIFISWRLITLQYCSGFCHSLTWISYGCTCVPHPEPPSHLPPHPIPLGLPSAPAPSTCLMHPTWTGALFHTW